MSETLKIGNCSFELLVEGDDYAGIGKVWIGDTLVRSGRLPMQLQTQAFPNNHEMREKKFLGVDQDENEVRIHLEANFYPLEMKMMRDHTMDVIHNNLDWNVEEPAATGKVDLVFTPAKDSFNGVEFNGFAYHYEYSSEEIPIFYLMDKASWELDGDVEGATLYSQSACSDPVVSIEKDTFFTTEGELFFLDESSYMNRTMVHNLPRWADHQAFDFQFKGDRLLVGVYEQVDLIRSVLQREPGKAELKCFDKTIFDNTNSYSTVPKKIMLATGIANPTQMKNVWSWMFEETNSRARKQFGLKAQPVIPFLGNHYWSNYTIDTYYKDQIPVCAALGIKSIFAENFKKSDASEIDRLPGGNMCGSKEYVISDRMGGTEKMKKFMERAHEHGIKIFMWTNTYVSYSAEINKDHRAEGDCWYMALEDTRTKHAGAYTNVSSNIDFKHPEARKYWVDCHRKIVQDTGLDGYFIDSHFNLFYMPVSFQNGPHTHWRESLEIMKELQDEGVEWQIESFGPFGQNVHGHPSSYDVSKIFICYEIGLGNDYVTVPIPGVETDKNEGHDPGYIFYQLAHKVPCKLPLFIDGVRIDKIYGEEHRRILREYHENLPQMVRRYLQEDNRSVLWHDADGKQATIWNFEDREAALPGTVADLSTGEELPKSDKYALKARHVYSVTGELPTTVA